MSFGVITFRNAVYEKFAGVCCGDMWRLVTLVLPTLLWVYNCLSSVSVCHLFSSLYCLPLWRINVCIKVNKAIYNSQLLVWWWAKNQRKQKQTWRRPTPPAHDENLSKTW